MYEKTLKYDARVDSAQPPGLFAGLSTVDLGYRVNEIPGPNQKVSTAAPLVAAGGPATNAAITFAFLGGKSTLITAVGGHALGAVIRQDLEHFGVSLHDIAAGQTAMPAVSSILVLPNGERSVVSANAKAFPELKIEIDREWLDGARFVLIDGHYPALCNTVASEARAAGLDVILDAGSWKEGMDALLSKATVALCSHDFRPPGCASSDDVFQRVVDGGVARVAITRGAESILYRGDAKCGEVAVENVQAVDTTGAGDVFHGAFCYRFSLVRDFADALNFAAKIATFSCGHLGTRSWMEAFRE